MGIQVQPFEEHHIEAVKAFNARIATQVDELENRFGGAAHSRLPESVVPTWLPPVEGSLLREEHFVAVEGDEVRGGYTLKFQEFSYRGKVHSMAGWHEPVSEGIIEKKYAAVGMMLLRAALKAEPHLYCTAMGGIDTVLPKLLKAMHWQLELSSFQFYVHRPYRFFRGLRHLRRDRGRVPARRLQKLAQERDAPPYALHAHAEPGVALGEVEPVFVGDRPHIQPRLHPVQRHGMARLAVHDGPARGVEAGILRKRSGMEVEATDTGCRDDVAMGDVERVDVQQEIHVLVAHAYAERRILDIGRGPDGNIELPRDVAHDCTAPRAFGRRRHHGHQFALALRDRTQCLDSGRLLSC